MPSPNITATELKALRILQGPHVLLKNSRMLATSFAQEMGWGKTPQGSARLGQGYLARMEKKGLIKRWHDDGDTAHGTHNPRCGFYASITPLGLEILGKEKP